MRRERWRQTRYFPGRQRARAAGRRSPHPRAVLGQLPGYRQVRRRHSGCRSNAAGRRLQRESGGHRESHYGENKIADSQFTQQSFRSCRPSGGIRAHSRRLKKHNVWLMGDECYSHFVYEPNKPFSIASVAGSKPSVIIIGSVSKTFAMTGWRIGYTLAPEPLVQALIKLQSQSTSNPTSIAQYAALAAMTGPMDSVPVMLAEYARRRKRIVEGLRAIDGVTCEWPGGAFYAFPNISAHLANGSAHQALGKSCTEISRLLLEKVQVALVPGEAFGAPGYLRLSYATSIDRIDEGLRRMERFFTRAEAAV